jgi:hypothetical protein
MPIANAAKRWWNSPVKAETWVFASTQMSLDRVPYDGAEGRAHLDALPYDSNEPWAAYLPVMGDPSSWTWDFDNLSPAEPTVLVSTADGDLWTYAEVVKTDYVNDLKRLHDIAKSGLALYRQDLAERVPTALGADDESPAWPLPSYIRASLDAMRRQAHTYVAIVTLSDRLSQGDYVRSLDDDERLLLLRTGGTPNSYRGTVFPLEELDAEGTGWLETLAGAEAPVCWLWSPELETEQRWREYGPSGQQCLHLFDNRVFSQEDLLASQTRIQTARHLRAVDRRLLGRLSNARAHRFTEESRGALARAMRPSATCSTWT